MGDYFYGEVTFPAIAMHHEEVLSSIRGDHAGMDRHEDGTVTVWDDNAPGGVPHLEDILLHLAVPFDRESSSMYEYDHMVRFYRPKGCGRPAIDEAFTGAADEVLVNVEDVINLGSAKTGHLNVRKLKRLLHIPEESVTEAAKRCEKAILRRIRKDKAWVEVPADLVGDSDSEEAVAGG